MVASSEDPSQRVIVAIVLITACLWQLATAPADNQFWNADAPRHALNGAFIYDLIAAFPYHDPIGWASDYYIRYPALTIGFYPPLFYFIEALVFKLLGVSEVAALVTVALFVLLLEFGLYRFARFLFPRWTSLGLVLLLLSAPEITLWSRQVMLDIPVFAAVVWAGVFVTAYVYRGSPKFLYATAAAIVAALYLKYNAIFIVVPIGLMLLTAFGPRFLLNKHFLIATAISVILLVPLGAVALRFAAVNIVNLAGNTGNTSADGWLYYIKILPEQIGLLPLFLGSIGAVLAMFRPPKLTRPLLVLLVSWIVFGYLFFSFIHIHEARHDLLILVPLYICSGHALHCLLSARIAPAVAFATGGVAFVITILTIAAPRITGYREITDYVAAHAPKNAIILFSGYRDGNFAFGMRTHPERSDLSILRADKLLLRLAVNREWGVSEVGLDHNGILKMLKDNAIGMVVVQRNFWSDIPQMARLQQVLDTPNFHKDALFEITGDLSTHDGLKHSDERGVEILTPTYTVPSPPERIEFDIPFARMRLDRPLSGRQPSLNSQHDDASSVK